MKNFTNQLSEYATIIKNALKQQLKTENFNEYGLAPEKLLAAMRHGSLNGGKRLRPFLLTETAAIFDVSPKITLDAALAIEMVHCYSLIHDDLPSMDDDDMRRGQASVHKKFNEATAILAGDNLLTFAFEIIATSKNYSPKLKNNLIIELAKASGAGGMVGGQMLDLDAENQTLSENEINNIQAMKTGALICASARMGALIGGASKKQILSLTKYATNAGWAFQLADDILDETATIEQMGKATKKDAERGKSTLVSNIGLEKANKQLATIIKAAILALEPFGERANNLIEIAQFFGERKS